MNRFLPLVATLILSAPLAAQDPDASKLEDKKQKKLQEAFLQKAPWITDYDKAREESKTTGKSIFAYFTRSYAY